MMQFFGIHWAAIQYVYVFVIFFLLMLIRLIYEYRVAWGIRKFVGKQQNILIINYSFFKKIITYFLFTIGLFFLCIALLRPCWGKTEDIVEQKGRDVVIAFDVSRSMLAHDLEPNRLAFAKNKVKKLLSYLPAERICLVVFAGAAIVQCPLTNDYAAFEMFLDNLDAQTISGGTTAIEQALKKSLYVFEQSVNKKTKLVVLFTDGEDFSSNLATIKEQVVKEKITVFTVGVGTESGAPIPIINDQGIQEGFEKDSTGIVIMSRLNEGILKVLAQESGGQYLRATNDDGDMKKIAAYVDQYEKESFENKNTIAWNEQYFYAAFIALIALLIEWII